MRCFHREGLVRCIKEKGDENCRKFLERNFPDSDKLDELITEEEKDLERVTNLLKKGSLSSHQLNAEITKLFQNPEALSTYQFIKSGFSRVLLRYYDILTAHNFSYVNNDANFKAFSDVISNASLMSSLITILNSALSRSERFEMLQPEIEAEDLARLGGTVYINIAEEEIGVGWLVSVWELEEKLKKARVCHITTIDLTFRMPSLNWF
jgi:hypothetical protein